MRLFRSSSVASLLLLLSGSRSLRMPPASILAAVGSSRCVTRSVLAPPPPPLSSWSLSLSPLPPEADGDDANNNGSNNDSDSWGPENARVPVPQPL